MQFDLFETSFTKSVDSGDIDRDVIHQAELLRKALQ
jgi:hypothetical protein